MESELCLVTGATGSVGPALVRHLAEAGYGVRVLARRPPPAGLFPASVEVFAGEIGDAEKVRGAAQGARYVFHLAAKLHVSHPGPELREEFWQVNVEGTRRVVEACLGAGVERLVYFSTIGVYGSHGSAPANEETPIRPWNLYSETKREGEEVVLAARPGSSGAALGVVLRFPAIYGHRLRGHHQRLVQALARGLFFLVGDGRNWRTVIYEENAARAALLAARHPLAAGRVYNVSDGKIYAQREIIEAICEALGRRPPRFSLPVRPIRWLAAGGDRLAGVVGRRGRWAALIDRFVEDTAIEAKRIQEELGFRPQVDLREGWRRSIAAWRAAGN